MAEQRKERPLDVLEEFLTARKAVIATLRRLADRLERSFEKKAENDVRNTGTSLFGSVVGLASAFAAPFSGGLSLLATWVATGASLGSMLNGRKASDAHESTEKAVMEEYERAKKQDRVALERLQAFFTLTEFAEVHIMSLVDDYLVEISEQRRVTVCIDFNTTAMENKRRELQSDHGMTTPIEQHILRTCKDVGTVMAGLSNAEKVTTVTSTTIKATRQTRCVTELTKTTDGGIKAANALSAVAKGSGAIMKSGAVSKEAACVMVKTGEMASNVRKTVEATKTVSDGYKTIAKSAGISTEMAQTLRSAREFAVGTKTVAKTAQTVSSAVSKEAACVMVKTGEMASNVRKTVEATKTVSDGYKTIAKSAGISTEMAQTLRSAREFAVGTKTVAKTAQTVSSAVSREAASVMVKTGEMASNVRKTVEATKTVSDGYKTIAKSAGISTEMAQTLRSAREFAVGTKTVAKTAQTVSTSMKTSKVMSEVHRGTDTTIKTAKAVKSAAKTVKTVQEVAKDADRAVRTTRVSRQAFSASKVTRTTTQAARVSKVAVALNAVFIPLDLWNFKTALDNRDASHSQVYDIRQTARQLENALMEMSTDDLKIRIEYYVELHFIVRLMYRETPVKVLYEYLEKSKRVFNLDIPSRDDP